MLLGVLNLKDTLTLYFVVLAIFLSVRPDLRAIHSPFGQV